MLIASFAQVIVSMIWGHKFFIFMPNVPRGHNDYEREIPTKYHIYFWPLFTNVF